MKDMVKTVVFVFTSFFFIIFIMAISLLVLCILTYVCGSFFRFFLNINCCFLGVTTIIGFLLCSILLIVGYVLYDVCSLMEEL